MRKQSFERDFNKVFKNFSTKNKRLIHKNIISNNKVFNYMKMIKEHDVDTYIHSLNVAAISYDIAYTFNCSAETLIIIVKAALLQDIGKTKIEKSILNKPSKLNHFERLQIERHPYLGYQLLVNDLDIEKNVAYAVLQHHERNDKSGYPNNLCDNEILFIAKIIAVADIFDAMSHKRSYKIAWPVSDVLEFINSMSGTLLDIDVVTRLNNIYNESLCKELS